MGLYDAGHSLHELFQSTLNVGYQLSTLFYSLLRKVLQYGFLDAPSRPLHSELGCSLDELLTDRLHLVSETVDGVLTVLDGLIEC
jgi:hypothetical protein